MRESCSRRARSKTSASSPSTRRLDRVDHGIPGVGQRVEDAVDEVVLRLLLLRHERAVEVVEEVALLLAHRDDEVARHVDVDLDRAGDGLSGARAPGGVEDDEDVRLVDVDLRPLAELARVLHRHRMQPEHVADPRERIRARAVQVEPEELVPLQQDPMRASSTSVSTSMSAWEPTRRKVCSAEPKSQPLCRRFGGNERRCDHRRGAAEVLRVGPRALWRGLHGPYRQRPRPARPQRGGQDHRGADTHHPPAT